MKKIFAILLCIAMIGSITGCSGSTETSQQEAKKEITTAEDYVNEFKAQELPIGDILVITAENDKNELLGRPGQYTSKVIFGDTNIEQSDASDEPKGGTIEVFKNKKDMEKRKEYLQSVMDNMGAMFVQYMYSKDNALLRLSKELTPEQAEKYEKVLSEIN